MARTSLQLAPKARGLPRPKASWGLPRSSNASWGTRPPEASRGLLRPPEASQDLLRPPKAQGPRPPEAQSLLRPSKALGLPRPSKVSWAPEVQGHPRLPKAWGLLRLALGLGLGQSLLRLALGLRLVQGLQRLASCVRLVRGAHSIVPACPQLAPLAPLAPSSLPHSQLAPLSELVGELGASWEWAGVRGASWMWYKALESPPPLVKKLWLSHIVLICAPLIPSLLPSLPMEWSELGGYADQQIFLGVPISCGGKFWSAHHLSWDKTPYPHSQVTPLTPKALSIGRAQWILRCTFWCPHYMSGEVSVHPPVLIG